MLGFPSSHTQPRNDDGSRWSRWKPPTWMMPFSSSSVLESSEIDVLFTVLCNLRDFIQRWQKSKQVVLLNRSAHKDAENFPAGTSRWSDGCKLSPGWSQRPSKLFQIMQSGRPVEEMHLARLFRFCVPTFEFKWARLQGETLLTQTEWRLNPPSVIAASTQSRSTSVAVPSRWNWLCSSLAPAGPTQVTFHGWSLILSHEYPTWTLAQAKLILFTRSSDCWKLCDHAANAQPVDGSSEPKDQHKSAANPVYPKIVSILVKKNGNKRVHR